jgi:hypothetical protein
MVLCPWQALSLDGSQRQVRVCPAWPRTPLALEHNMLGPAQDPQVILELIPDSDRCSAAQARGAIRGLRGLTGPALLARLCPLGARLCPLGNH